MYILILQVYFQLVPKITDSYDFLASMWKNQKKSTLWGKDFCDSDNEATHQKNNWFLPATVTLASPNIQPDVLNPMCKRY